MSYEIFKNKLAIFGLFILGLLVFSAITAPYLSPFDPAEQNLKEGLRGSTSVHPLGQDKLGRDILSRILYGSRVSLFVGTTTVTVSLLIGILIGSMTGYYGGMIDELFMRIADIFLAFPGILLAIAFTAILGPSLNNVIIALCLMGWVGYARVIRAQFLWAREQEYVMAARAIGARSLRIVSRHILPNVIAPVIVEATFGMAGAILAEAGLSFLGLGVQPPTASWGSMLNEGRGFLLQAPHMTIFPGLAIALVVMAFNFLGDSLRDSLDPRGRR